MQEKRLVTRKNRIDHVHKKCNYGIIPQKFNFHRLCVLLTLWFVWFIWVVTILQMHTLGEHSKSLVIFVMSNTLI